MIPLIQGTWNNKIHRDQKRNARGWRELVFFKGYRVSVLEDEESSGNGWW